MTSVIDGRPSRPLREPLRTPLRKQPVGVAQRGRSARPSVSTRLSVTRQASTAKWNNEAIGLLVVAGFLVVIGLVFILSASSVYSLGANDSVWGTFLRQLRWEAIGLVALGVCAKVGVRNLRRFWAPLWTVTVVLLFLVRFTPLGVERNGSPRWIGPPSFEIQPSELAKLAIVAAFAHLLTLKRDYSDWRVALKPLAGFGLPLIGLVGLQPDLGTTSVIAAAGFTVLWAGGIKSRWMAGLFLGGGSLALVSARINAYQWDRVTAFMNPKSDAAFHIRRSLAGIHAGGFDGVGIGASRSKWGFLPNAHTDFIFSVIAEEVGLIGAAIVVALFAAFGVLGVRIALRAPDRFSSLVSFGITGWILSQAFANIAAVTGVAPVTGVPLPFVSQGGTAFVSLMVALGLLLDVARRGSDQDAPQRRNTFADRLHPSQRHSPSQPR
jgi:cell division protein FtsW